jgi:hypothetical protein
VLRHLEETLQRQHPIFHKCVVQLEALSLSAQSMASQFRCIIGEAATGQDIQDLEDVLDDSCGLISKQVNGLDTVLQDLMGIASSLPQASRHVQLKMKESNHTLSIDSSIYLLLCKTV